MVQSQETFEHDGAWTRLMAELRDIHERAAYATTLHRIMQQRAPCGVPVQYERLIRHAQGGTKETTHDRPRGISTSRRRRLRCKKS
jgi:hypothetical protein